MGHLYHGYVSHNQRVYLIFENTDLLEIVMLVDGLSPFMDYDHPQSIKG
jgi:hypothetical protein